MDSIQPSDAHSSLPEMSEQLASYDEDGETSRGGSEQNLPEDDLHWDVESAGTTDVPHSEAGDSNDPSWSDQAQLVPHSWALDQQEGTPAEHYGDPCDPLVDNATSELDGATAFPNSEYPSDASDEDAVTDEPQDVEPQDHADALAPGGFAHEALLKILDEVAELKSSLQGIADRPENNESTFSDDTDAGETPFDSSAAWSDELENARQRAEELQLRCDELTEQNQDLARQIAGDQVRHSINDAENGPDPSSDLLSWEERKELIYRQLEDDAFDAESFLSTMQSDPTVETDAGITENVDPTEIVTSLFGQLDQMKSELARREDEIGELRCILEQRDQITDADAGIVGDDVAVGAAAIAQMLDGDALIQEERDRLHQMQAEWEEKFRKVEIEASLERAKLSRERQELATKNAELEEQLEHLRREARAAEANPGKKRRWLAELGLTSE